MTRWRLEGLRFTNLQGWDLDSVAEQYLEAAKFLRLLRDLGVTLAAVHPDNSLDLELPNAAVATYIQSAFGVAERLRTQDDQEMAVAEAERIVRGGELPSIN